MPKNSSLPGSDNQRIAAVHSAQNPQQHVPHHHTALIIPYAPGQDLSHRPSQFVATIPHLQRILGNQAVQMMVASEYSGASSQHSYQAPGTSPGIQDTAATRHPALRFTHLQRKLIVGDEDYSTDNMEIVQDMAMMAQDDMIEWFNQQMSDDSLSLEYREELRQLAHEVQTHGDQIMNQMMKWIHIGKNKPYGKHSIYGRKEQNRKYANWHQAAKALLGWVKAKPGRKLEKVLAQDIYSNPEVDSIITGLVTKVRLRIQELQKTRPAQYLDISRELQTNETLMRAVKNAKQGPMKFGHYEKELAQAAAEFHAPGLLVAYVNKWQILLNPQDFKLRDKIIFLHDITEYLGKHQAWNPVTGGQGLIPMDNQADAHVTTGVDVSGERTTSVSAMSGDRTNDKQARGMGLTTASRDEEVDSTRFARQLNLPIWAGQSMTAVRMLNMAQWSGGMTFDFNALAQGIFAFWRLEYNHTSEFAYHTLHEVMDIAKNFGVSYKTPPSITGLDGVQFDRINKEYIQPIITQGIDGLLKQYRGLEQAAGQNTWQNKTMQEKVVRGLEEQQNRLLQLKGTWESFDFTEADDARRTKLGNIMRACHIIQFELKELDAFIRLYSNSLSSEYPF